MTGMGISGWNPDWMAVDGRYETIKKARRSVMKVIVSRMAIMGRRTKALYGATVAGVSVGWREKRLERSEHIVP